MEAMQEPLKNTYLQQEGAGEACHQDPSQVECGGGGGGSSYGMNLALCSVYCVCVELSKSFYTTSSKRRMFFDMTWPDWAVTLCDPL